MSTDTTDTVAPPAEADRPTGRFGAASLGVPPPTLEPAPAEPERRRRRWPWVLGAVLVALALLAGSFLGGRAVGARGQVQVWQVRVDLPAGAALRPGDVAPVRVSTAAARTALPADTPVVGRIVRTSVRTGQLLPRKLLTRGSPLPRPGEVLIGIATAPGGAPDGLLAGDEVAVVRLPVTSATTGVPPNLDSPGTQILQRVPVYSVVPSGQGAVVTIVAPALAGPTLAALSAQNRIALVAQPAAP